MYLSPEEKWPMPEINEKEVLIKMDSVGICGSDVKMYTAGQCGSEKVSKPIVMGHEGAGTVIKVGAEVSTLNVGDRVAIEPTQPCRSCALCRAGRYNLCAAPRYCSTVGGDGNLCRYYKHVADFCHKIPDNMTMEEAAAVQPLAIAIHACNRAGVKIGSNLLVLGAGPIGILCAMSARAMGASSIIMTDVVESRLETARKLCADHTLLVGSHISEEESVEKVIQLLGRRPDISIDASGYASAQRLALMATETGGLVLVVGIADSMSNLPLSSALLREVDIRGSYRIMNTYPPAIAAVSSRAISLKPFITHHFPIEKSKDAFDLAKTGDAMKIIIHL
ncbi:sorbitol dehydrogenase-like isoform X2 [Epargyreus clarus]|uniref:sorbitol dehydrogenase-like isoform X2 n=1 Tax=Epargyreus clarus TaxID=520877 RepID=UPI003C2ECB0C